MQSQNRLFDDFVKVMNGAAGTLAGMTREAQGAMQERFKEWVAGMDFVTRDEFEAARAMAVSAREECDRLRARIDALEASGPAAAGAAPSRPGPARRRKPSDKN
ncbi:MAG: accessory factor UbiK family protein [Sphingosinicella sp.]